MKELSITNELLTSPLFWVIIIILGLAKTLQIWLQIKDSKKIRVSNEEKLDRILNELSPDHPEKENIERIVEILKGNFDSSQQRGLSNIRMIIEVDKGADRNVFGGIWQKIKNVEEISECFLEERADISKIDKVSGILNAIERETLPIPEHTDPGAIEDCWREVYELLEELKK